MTSQERVDCYEQGQEAAEVGLQLSDSPYKMGTKEYEYWELGYLDQKAIIEEHNGYDLPIKEWLKKER